MSSYQRQLNSAIEHGEKMSASGVKHGRYIELSDLTHDILMKNVTEVSEVLKIISERQIKINSSEE